MFYLDLFSSFSGHLEENIVSAPYFDCDRARCSFLSFLITWQGSRECHTNLSLLLLTKNKECCKASSLVDNTSQVLKLFFLWEMEVPNVNHLKCIEWRRTSKSRQNFSRITFWDVSSVHIKFLKLVLLAEDRDQKIHAVVVAPPFITLLKVNLLQGIVVWIG